MTSDITSNDEEKCVCCMYPQCNAEPVVIITQRRVKTRMFCKAHAVCFLVTKIQQMQVGFFVSRYRKCMQ
jgi:hypothetical protein